MDLGIRSYLQYNAPDGITLSLPKKIYEGGGKMNPTRVGFFEIKILPLQKKPLTHTPRRAGRGHALSPPGF